MTTNPCKFCGCIPTLREADVTSDGPSYYYRCKPCGNRSGIFLDADEARKHWNKVNPDMNPNSHAKAVLANAKARYA